jgi:hypothetical protein
MAYVVNFYRVSGLSKIYFNATPTPVASTDLWAATWVPTDSTAISTPFAAESIGNVNVYTYVKPMIHINDCIGDGGYDLSTATQFILGSNCGTPNNRLDFIISKLNALPSGKRAYRTMRYDNGPIYNEVGDRYVSGRQSPWAENAGTTLNSDVITLFTRLGNSGAVPDYIIIDCEQGSTFAFPYASSTNWTNQIFGITNDSKFNQTWYGSTSFNNLYTQGGSYAFGFANLVNGTYHPQNTRDYLFWDRAVEGIHSALLNQFIVTPLKSIYPSVKVTNYNSMVILDGGTFGNAYDYNGHPIVRTGIVGDAASPELYAGWTGASASYGILNTDTTRIVRTDFAGTTAFPSNTWNQLLVLVQKIRAVKRGDPNTPIIPWIASPYFVDNSVGFDAKWNDNYTNLGLYYESIRHFALTGVQMFNYFNSAETDSTKVNTACTKLNSVLTELNTLLGGYTLSSQTYNERINFLTDYIISGAPTNRSTYLWRVTPKPGIVLEHPDGTIIEVDSDGGAWIETESSSIPTLYSTLSAPYEIVFKYLMAKYEPEWGVNSSTEGKTARASALGVSASYNPFGSTGGTAYQYIAYTPLIGASAGYFDPLSHPRLYSKAIETSGYRRLSRARGHTAAKHRFVDDWNIPGTIGDVYYDRGGNQNTFYGYAPRYSIYPSGGETTDNLDDYRKQNTKALHFNFQLNLNNKIERYYVHSPYGKMQAGIAHETYLIDSGYSSRLNERITLPAALRCMPWISNRYTAESFLWDMYLYLREETCLRDFTLNPLSTRTEISNSDALNTPFSGSPTSLSILDYTGVGYTYDIHLNTQYSGMTYEKGQFGATLIYATQKNRPGGFTQDVNVGSPWIKYTGGFYWDIASGQTKFEWFGTAPLGLCFDKRTLVMFDGSTWGITPPTLSTTFKPILDAGFNNFFADYGSSSLVGISFGYGKKHIEAWDRISSDWGDQIEFIGYMGTLPYGQGAVETFVPYMMYRNPTNSNNVDYFKWRLDASMSHWKHRFKSPIDGFARIIFENGGTQRSYHVYEAPGYTKYVNTLSSGVSFVDNIIVSWCRDQYNYTYGPSGPNPNKGMIVGTETFAYYNFKWDGWVDDSNNTEFTRFKNDQTPPSHWANDSDIATDLYSSIFNVTLGQRKYGFTYSDSLWKKGVCGSTKLGEIFAAERPYFAIATTLDAYPYFHNTFIDYVGGPITTSLKWKRVPNTWFGAQTPDGATGGVPWIYDRRFRLLFLYPLAIYLNMSIIDPMHSGSGYYNMTVEPRPLGGWYDKALGNTYLVDMDYSFSGTHTSNPIVSNVPYANRRNPTKPPQNNWNPFDIDNSDFELLYSCMKGGLTGELDSLGFSDIYTELQSRGSTGFPAALFL